jgi:transcriptional regulator with XRE-family HTH domain
MSEIANKEPQLTTSKRSIGERLRAIRIALGLTLRDVEEKATQIATQTDNSDHRISASWLHRVERQNRDLAASKLIILAKVYGKRPEDFIDFPPAPLYEVEPKIQPESLGSMPAASDAISLLESASIAESLTNLKIPTETSLLAHPSLPICSKYILGALGLEDHTLFPMVPPGSIVFIERARRGIAHKRSWNNEYDQPIYFLCARTSYHCGFCQLDKDAEWLTLVPHVLSPVKTERKWRFKKDIEVIGSVAGVLLRRKI